MKFPRIVLSLFGIFALLGVGYALNGDNPIEEIMNKAMKKGGLRQQITIEVDKDSPNWELIQKKSKELTKYCGDLCKQSPPKGDPESWKKLTEALADNVKKVDEFISKKDQANAKLTLKKINGSCKTCHDAHRE
jgi:hypothetical protein